MIEKVGYTKPVGNARPVRKAGSVAAPGFAEALSKAEGVSAPEAASPVTGITGVGLLGIQEVNEDEVRRRQAMKRGRMTLEVLEKLRDGLLFGSIPVSVLKNLEKLVAEERALSYDPALNAVLDEIELRAAVEMAKLEVAGLL